jgi:hypothetical protein
MHKATHKKLNPISLGLLALFGCLTTASTYASAEVLTQSTSSSSTNDIQELEVTKVEDSTQTADLNTLLPIEIRTSRRSDLSEALSFLPSVRVDNTASSSNRQGDIRPAEFSIRGAAPYQNNIQLDNASIDSLLDPAQKVLPGQTPSRTQTEGHSQAVFIDPRFIDSIEILDTNISAVEGGFTGGVVKAKTRSYSGQNEFGISHRITKDSWTEFHIDEDLLTEFGEGAAQIVTGTPGEFQPNFDKSETSISGATRIGNFGVFVGFSEKSSEITQKRTTGLAIPGDFAYFLETGNVFKRGDSDTLNSNSRFATVRIDALEVPYDLYTTLSYSNYEQETFLINFLNSDYTSQNEGLGLSVNYGDSFDNTRVESTVSINISNNERSSDVNRLDNFTGRNFFTQQAFIGSFGDLKSEQQRVTTEVNLVTTLSDTTAVAYGAELSRLNLTQNRENDFIDIQHFPDSAQKLNGLQGAVPYDEHHINREVTYAAGDIDFISTNWAAYAELTADNDSLFYRAGFRVTHDDFIGNTNTAPRFSIGRYLNDDQSFKVTLGANRYYGKSFLSYRLRDEEKKFVSIRTRETAFDPNSPLIASRGADEWLGSQLDTPFDDEYSLQFLHSDFAGTLGLTFVKRDGKDQIRTFFNADDETRQYQNFGKSQTEQVDLTWRSERVDWASATWIINASASWMDQQTDARYINGGYGNLFTDANEQVIFKGEQIGISELPAADFATPVSAVIDVITLAFDEAMSISNTFTLTDGFQYLNRTGSDEQTGLDTYEVQDQGSAFSWDLSLLYRFKTDFGAPYIRADIINVTDSENIMRFEAGTQLFSLGRQYWIEVGYEF